MNIRPTMRHECVIKFAAEKLAPKVLEWLEEEGDLEEIGSTLRNAMKYEYDGYDIAKNLDRDGYTPDARLVEILDDTFFLKKQALDKLEVEWVKACELKEPQIGATFQWVKHTEYGIGKVSKNYPSGKSVVSFESQGHSIGCGNVIPWEELTPLEIAPEHQI